MLTSTWDSECSKAIIAGITERIGDDDTELHIFNAYDDLMPTEYFRKGREIYYLPDAERFDGLIIALITIDSVKYASEITEKFHKLGKPVVGLDTHADHAIFCGLDNYRSMYQLVDHMVTIHDCRIFNFLGGPEDNSENMERYRAYCDCLDSHGIKTESKRILFKNFRKMDGNEAYREWKERGVNMADAVICANDFMALGFVEEATKDGVTVPDYLKVTGFDNIVEAQKYSPSITSVNRNWKALGYESMDILSEALEHKPEYDTRFVEGYISFNESCGCDLTRDIRADYSELVKRKKIDTDYAYRQNYSRQILVSSRSMDEFMEALADSKKRLDIKDVAVGVSRSFFDIDPDSDVVGYDNDMVLYTDDGREDTDRRKQLLPARWRKDSKVYLYASLRNNRQTYGYTVMPYNSDFFTRARHRNFVESLSIALENISQSMAISKLKKQLEDK